MMPVCPSVGGIRQQIPLVVKWRQRRFDNFVGAKLVVDAADLVVRSGGGEVFK